jgi:hypothetical protein
MKSRLRVISILAWSRGSLKGGRPRLTGMTRPYDRLALALHHSRFGSADADAFGKGRDGLDL